MQQDGQPTHDYSNDSEGKPEGKMSKAVRGGAKMASKVTKKFVKDSGEPTSWVPHAVRNLLQEVLCTMMMSIVNRLYRLLILHLTQYVFVSGVSNKLYQQKAHSILITSYHHLGLVDEDTANIIEGVADAAENQASADGDASLADRLKMAGGDTAGMVADNVDNPYVAVSHDSNTQPI